MGEVVKLPQGAAPAERVAATLALVKPLPKVQLRNMDEAVALLDEWTQAYHRLRRQAERECSRLQEDLTFARVDLTIEQSERLLERIAFQEEIARLRKLIV